MTLYQFNALDEMEQMEAIWTGTELAKREADGYRITLIQIDSFYVEMYHHIQHDTLKRIRGFSIPDHNDVIQLLFRHIFNISGQTFTLQGG